MPHLVAVLVLLALLLPRSMMDVASKVGYEMHVVSFIIGPATYSFGDHLVPGVHYFTQYSVGLPYLFSWVIGKTADAAIVNYVRLMVWSMFFFYLGLFYCLRWLLTSVRWALATTATILVLQFHVERTFFDPSSYVLRYPLLVLTIWAASVWIASNFSISSTVLTAACIGGSFFLNTETGLYQALAVTTLGIVGSRATIRGLVLSLMPGLGGVVMLAGLCYLAFGEAVFSLAFIDGLTLPFFIYGGGFGGVSIDWRYGWHLLYNIIAPGIAVVTAVVCTSKLVRDDVLPQDRARFAALLMFCLAAIMLSAKYINMSLVALWHVNAIGFLVVIAWWARQIHYRLAISDAAPKAAVGFRRTTQFAVLLAVLAVGLIAFANDPRNVNYYGLRAWSKYPAAVNPLSWLNRPTCSDLACSAPRISPQDVALINRWAPPAQRVAILGWNDWSYLVQARRASWFHFLPSPATFTQQQLAAAASPPEILFLPKSVAISQLESIHPELARKWSASLNQHKFIEAGHDLAVWRADLSSKRAP